MNRSSRPSRRRFLKTAVLALAAPAFHIHVRAGEGEKLWRTGNPLIDLARELALNLLKPTAAQLQHAWELHQGALVFDSYGFAPRAAVDGAKFQEAVEAGAVGDELVDLREEM